MVTISEFNITSGKIDTYQEILSNLKNTFIQGFQQILGVNRVIGQTELKLQNIFGAPLTSIRLISIEKLTFYQRFHIFINICLKIAALHEKGVYFNNICTEELIIEDFENFMIWIKIFPYFHLLKKNKISQFIKNHPQTFYIAPEIRNEEIFSPKSDIWSLGILLYEIFDFEIPEDWGEKIALISNKKKDIFTTEHLLKYLVIA